MYVMLDVVPIVAERSSACAQSSEGPHGAFVIVQAVGLTPERLVTAKGNTQYCPPLRHTRRPCLARERWTRLEFVP